MAKGLRSTPNNHHQPTTNLSRLRNGSYSTLSSGRHSPCPACGRIKDADCRWGDEWISCHTGAAAPGASNLKIGQVLTIDGADWFLASNTGGHSGGAFIYRPHRPGYTRRTSSPAGVFSDEDLAATAQARRFHQALRPRVHAALRLPCWEQQTLQELDAAEHFLKDTLSSAQQALRLINRARRIDPPVSCLLPVTRHWIRALGYQLADLNGFYRCCLHSAGGRR